MEKTVNSKKRLFSILLALLMIISVVIVNPVIKVYAVNTTYYVDSNNGNDNNNGTSTSTAWRTISKVNAGTYLPGDNILFAAGQTFSGEVDMTASGSSGNPITIGSYGTGRATINAGNANGIHWVNSAYIVVKDLIITGSGSANRGSGVLIENTLGNGNKKDYVRIDNLKVSGFALDGYDNTNYHDCLLKGVGIYVGGNPTNATKCGFNDVQITNCETYNNEMCGILVSGYWLPSSTTYSNSNVLIKGCIARNNLGNSALTSNWSGNGILLNDTDTGTIERCVAYSNGANNNSNNGGPVGIWAHHSNYITIQFNESYDNRSGTLVDGGGFDLDGGMTNSTMQYNYSHGNHGPGYSIYSYGGAPNPSNNLTVRYNISENDGIANTSATLLVAAYTSMSNIYVYNNTIYSNYKGISVQRNINLNNAYFWNNIIYSGSSQSLVQILGSGGSNIAFQGNNYYTTSVFNIYDVGTNFTSLNSWRAATGQETYSGTNTGYSVNPGLVNPGGGGTIGNANNLTSLSAYKFSSGSSPMIDSGLNINTMFGINPGSIDFYENSIPEGNGYDIGANESPYTGQSVKGEWRLNENTGSTAVDVRNGNNGSLVNGPSWTTGYNGSALNFDGVNSYVNIPNSTTMENVQEGDYTLSAWVKADTIPQGTGSANNAYYGIVVKNGNHEGIYFANDGKFAMTHWFADGTGMELKTSDTYSSGTWYFVTGVVNKTDGTIKIYVNGILKGTSTFTPNKAAKEYNQNTWKIGIADPSAATYRWAMDGNIDEVRIYSGSLYGTQILDLYDSYAAPNDPQGEWKLNENTGSTAVDVRNGNNGSLVNGPSWTTGHNGSALNFDGVNSYVNIPNSTTMENVQEDDYTLSAWVKADTIPQGTGSANNANYGIVIKNGYHEGMYLVNSGKFAITHWFADDTGVEVQTSDTYSSGTWYFVTGVVSKTEGTIKIYVNGILKGTSTFTPNKAAKEYYQNTWKIGIALPDAATYRWAMDGNIDEVRIYNRKLNDDGVMNLFLNY